MCYTLEQLGTGFSAGFLSLFGFKRCSKKYIFTILYGDSKQELLVDTSLEQLIGVIFLKYLAEMKKILKYAHPKVETHLLIFPTAIGKFDTNITIGLLHLHST